MNSFSRVSRPLRVLILSAVALFALVPVAGAAKNVDVKVMTRNLYLGADLTPVLAAPSAPAAFDAAGNVYEGVLETNFPARAKLLANEVKANNPDVIGLQEVALWRRSRGTPPDGPATPSTEVVVDFLDQLQLELRRRGMNYKVAVKQTEADLEVPVDGVFEASDGSPDWDGRLTMRDVILVKRTKTMRTLNARHGNYSIALSATTALGTLTVERGWGRVDIRKGTIKKGRLVRAKSVRVVNTHLEAFSPFHRNAQASELVNTLPTLSTPKPVIVLGDLNSDPDDPTLTDPDGPGPAPAFPNAAAYETMLDGTGLVDRGLAAGTDTCCHDADLLNGAVAFGPNQRIDHVLTKPKLGRLNRTRTGDDPALRTSGGNGLWPSDHAGVVVGLRLP